MWTRSHLATKQPKVATDQDMIFGTNNEFTIDHDSTTDGLVISRDGVGMLAVDEASIAGFTAAADTAGKDIYLATQTAGTDSGSDPRGGDLHLELGAGTGTGRRGQLSIGGQMNLTESVDSAAVADQVSLSRYEIGAGNTVLAISQETAVVADADETKFSNKMQIRINGSTYYMMLTTT